MSGILTSSAIEAAISKGEILITPFNSAQLNVTSYDLTLGNEVRVYSNWVHGAKQVNMAPPSPRSALSRMMGWDTDPDPAGERFLPLDNVLDVKAEPTTDSFQIGAEGFVLKPGIGYLMHTAESVCSTKFNPILDGKSSIARLFIQVHATAGYGDPYFAGQYTLEVIVQHPVRVYPGMRIAQVRFHTIEGEITRRYDQVGHYVGEAAAGAVASQVWKQFQGK